MSTFRFEDPQMAPVSRATWAACQARIAELEALLAQSHGGHLVTAAAAQRAEARLAAVIALCDDPTWGGADSLDMFARDVHAAATGDTT